MTPISRRQFVTHGVAVGAACWVAPTIVSVPVAWANPPHSVPPRPSKPPKNVSPPMGPPIATGIPAQLPFTGQEQKREIEVGVAAVAAGAALYALNRPEKRPTT